MAGGWAVLGPEVPKESDEPNERTVNPHVSHDELTDRLKPVVGPEIEATMLTEGQRLEKRGYDVGHKQGHKQGYNEGQLDILLRLLTRRFGPLPASVAQRVSNASADELLQWSERVLDAVRLDDVFAGS